jgi:hypothetical protein
LIILALGLLLIMTLWRLYAHLNTILGGSVDEPKIIVLLGKEIYLNNRQKHAPQSVIGQRYTTTQTFVESKKIKTISALLLKMNPMCQTHRSSG